MRQTHTIVYDHDLVLEYPTTLAGKPPGISGRLGGSQPSPYLGLSGWVSI